MTFSRDISYGALLQAGVVLCGVIAYIVTSNTRGETTQTELSAFKVDMTKQIAELRTSLNQNMTEMRGELRSVPSDIRSMEGRLNLHEQHDHDFELRLDAVERDATELRAKYGVIDSLVNGPLTTRRRP